MRVSAVHGAGSNSGISTMRVSSRPSTSTFVATKRLSATRHSPCCLLNGQHDFGIRAAATEIAAQRCPNVGLTRRCVLIEQRGRRENLAGRAKAALHRVVRNERLLERMHRRGAEPFDGGDGGAVACRRKRETGVNGPPGSAARFH